MKNRFFLNFFVLTMLGLVITFNSCKQAEKAETVEEAAPVLDLSVVKAEIQAFENEWAKLLNEKNLDALMAMYADDAVSMPPNAPMLVGKEAIRATQEADMSEMEAGQMFSFETMDVYGGGDTFTEIGKSAIKDASGAVKSTGKYIVVFKKIDGKYMVVREMYGSDAM